MSTQDFPTLSLDEILNGRKAAQKSVPICMRLDVLADIEEREREIKRLKSDNDDGDVRMVSSNETTAADLADQIRELEAEAQRYTIDLRLTAVDRKHWNAKVDEHTERNDDGESKLDLSGLAEDLFPDSLVSPAMGAEQRTRFLAGLSEGQWESVLQAIWDLNRRTVTVGKSLTASFATRPKNEKRGPAEQ